MIMEIGIDIPISVHIRYHELLLLCTVILKDDSNLCNTDNELFHSYFDIDVFFTLVFACL